MGDIEQGNSEWHGLKNNNNDRNGFIRKVYAILSMQLSITTFITGLAVGIEGFRNWMQVNYWFVLLWAVISIITIFALVCCKNNARRVPTNYILLGIFTLAESFLVANFAAFYDPITILIAAVMTLGVTIGVTAYACFTKRDFTTCYGTMFGIMVGGILFAIFMGIFYNTRPIQIVVCLVFIIIYTIYIVIDTQAIAGGRSHELSFDDYIIGALCLYIDIIGLFIYILSLIGGRR